MPIQDAAVAASMSEYVVGIDGICFCFSSHKCQRRFPWSRAALTSLPFATNV